VDDASDVDKDAHLIACVMVCVGKQYKGGFFVLQT
jgi:hypothetical protein